MSPEDQVHQKIERFMLELTQIHRLWDTHVILPYTNQYVAAHDRFTAQLEAAAKREAHRADLAILALSLAGGGVATAVFGTTAIKVLAADAVLTEICERNMTRAFAALAYIDAKQPWIGFTAGQLFDQGLAALKSDTQQRIRGLAEPAPSKEMMAQLGADHPIVVQNVMTSFIEDRLSKGYDIAASIRDDRVATPDQKLAAVRALAQSPLYHRPPELKTEGLAEDIELGLFMQLVLSRDSLVTLVRDRIGKNMVHARVARSQSIAPVPGQPGYPRSQSPTGAWAYGSSWEEVRVAELESGLRDHIDGLYRTRVGGSAFFSGSWYERKIDAGALQKAAATLQTLAARTRLPDVEAGLAI